MISNTENRRGKAQTAQSQVAEPAVVAAAPMAPTVPAPPVRKTKAALLRDLLSAPGGASLQSMMEATGWQAHTVRAALSGLRKSGVTLIRMLGEAGATYAIVAAGEDTPEKVDDAEPAPPPSRKKTTKAATEQVDGMIVAVDGDAGGTDAASTMVAATSDLAASS